MGLKKWKSIIIIPLLVTVGLWGSSEVSLLQSAFTSINAHVHDSSDRLHSFS